MSAKFDRCFAACQLWCLQY